jgi:hypothetical protein
MEGVNAGEKLMNYTVINSYENLGNKKCHTNRSGKKRCDLFTLTDSVQIVKKDRMR